MLYRDIIQGTDEWNQLRYRKVGGSSNAKVMTNLSKSVKDNAIFFELLGQFTEDFEIEESRYLSAKVERGNELEPEARSEFARIYGKEVFEIGWSESSDFTGISPDGIVKDGKVIKTESDVTKALEIKCPTKNTYVKYLINKDLALEDYVWQIVTYFKEFPNLGVLYFFIYRPENKIKNHILIEVRRSTVIAVDKKLVTNIDELVEILAIRQEMLKKALDAKVLELEDYDLPF